MTTRARRDTRVLTVVLSLAALGACGRRAEPEAVAARDHLYLWTASADSTQPDFLAVLDVTREGERYGSLVTTIAVPELNTGPHHTEHELAPDRQLFANGFAKGQSYIFDLSVPDAPRIAGTFGDVEGYAHPHSFLRLPNGHVLATFQMRHDPTGGMRTGGLVEMTPNGSVVRSHSADYDGASPALRLYSAGIVPSLDRIVTTSTDMDGEDADASRTVQFWRLGDLTPFHHIDLPGPNGSFTAEPRVLEDGRTVLVSTFSCGLFLVEGLEGDAPSARQVAAFPEKPGTSCAIPSIVGHHYLVTVPAWSAVVVLDIADPSAPREVSRVAFADDEVPHWISVSPDGKRVVVTGYDAMEHRVYLMDFDAATGRLSLDTRFREPGASTPGFRMDDKQWPHGSSAKGVPHGAVFSRP